MQFEICDIRFRLRAPSDLRILPPPPEYGPFLGSTPDTETRRLFEVNVVVSAPPDTRGMSKILGGEPSWSMFVDRDRYVLEWKTAASAERFQSVVFDRQGKDITIHCSEESLLSGPSGRSLPNPFCYPVDQILLMYLLSSMRGAVVHAAGMILHDRAYVFPGRSGAGKSTLSRLLRWREGATMLSDDRMILRDCSGVYRGFGTPWPGDEGIAENRDARLGGIFFLRHAMKSSIAALSPAEALTRMIPVTSIPWHHTEHMSAILDFCGDLARNVPAYEFRFAPDSDSAECLERFISRI